MPRAVVGVDALSFTIILVSAGFAEHGNFWQADVVVILIKGANPRVFALLADFGPARLISVSSTSAQFFTMAPLILVASDFDSAPVRVVTTDLTLETPGTIKEALGSIKAGTHGHGFTTFVRVLFDTLESPFSSLDECFLAPFSPVGFASTSFA